MLGRRNLRIEHLILQISLGDLGGVPGDAVRDDERRVLLSEAHPDVRRTGVDDDEIGASLRD